MPLLEEMERSGSWLFRWRSYIPLVVIVPMLIAMNQFEYVGHRHELQEVWSFFCMTISFAGLAVRMATVGHAPDGTSGRNTRSQIAAQLNTTGWYSVVRHPLYLGNFVIWLGVSMFYLTWWLTTIFVLLYWIYYERIMLAEEQFLRRTFGQAYLDWADATPAIVPDFRLWRRPELSFSWRTVLRREYCGAFAIVAAFYVLEISEHLVVERSLVFETHWTIIFFVALLLFLTLRTLKRNATVLHVPGR